MEDLFSNKTTVEITVVKINNQKLTKSILNQIELFNPFLDGNFADGTKIFGYVNCKIKDYEKNVIFVYKNKLYFFPYFTLQIMATIKENLKYRFDELTKFNFGFFKNYSINEFFEWDDYTGTDIEKNIKDVITKDELVEINKAQINLINLLKEIDDRLIIV